MHHSNLYVSVPLSFKRLLHKRTKQSYAQFSRCFWTLSRKNAHQFLLLNWWSVKSVPLYSIKSLHLFLFYLRFHMHIKNLRIFYIQVMKSSNRRAQSFPALTRPGGVCTMHYAVQSTCAWCLVSDDDVDLTNFCHSLKKPNGKEGRDVIIRRPLTQSSKCIHPMSQVGLIMIVASWQDVIDIKRDFL